MSNPHKLASIEKGYPPVTPVCVEVPRPVHAITTKFVPGDLVWLMVSNKAVIKKVTTVTMRLVHFPEAILAGYDIRIELLLDETEERNKSAVTSIFSDETYCFHTKTDLLASL